MILNQSRDSMYVSSLFSSTLEQRRLRDLEFKDIRWILGAIALLFVYHIFYMRSIVLSTYSIMMIVFAFAVTQILYVGVFKIEYFTPWHNLIVIMMLGIGSNNTLIIFNAWKQSEQI